MGEALLLEWYGIWSDNVITTSNLALNRAWRQRLPVIQTGYDFVSMDTVTWLEQLHQCPYDKMAKMACEKRDFELFKYCFTSIDYKFNLIEYVKIIVQNNYSEFFEIFEKSWIMNVNILTKIAYYAAKYGNKDLLKWTQEEHIDIPNPDQVLKGAAKHSAQMFNHVCSFLPKPIGITSEVLIITLSNVELSKQLASLFDSGRTLLRPVVGNSQLNIKTKIKNLNNGHQVKYHIRNASNCRK